MGLDQQDFFSGYYAAACIRLAEAFLDRNGAFLRDKVYTAEADIVAVVLVFTSGVAQSYNNFHVY
jgi:hypothetical protein